MIAGAEFKFEKAEGTPAKRKYHNECWKILEEVPITLRLLQEAT